MQRGKLRRNSRTLAAGLALIVLTAAGSSSADSNDNLNATAWTQNSVEFKGVALGAYRLATLMLDKALADRSWTAIPGEQGEDYTEKPPAVILDVDETVLDNSGYQAWMVLNDESFGSKTWGAFVNTVTSTPIAGSLEFTKYADSKGVKVFYVSNRTGDLEEATRQNLQKYGYPMGGNVDTVLLKKEREEWASSKKSPRRMHVGQDYRVLLLIGDNFGDFVDGYKGSIQERHELMEKHQAYWGEKWIVLPNPTYGSWESATFGHDYKLPTEDKRAMKKATLKAWTP